MKVIDLFNKIANGEEVPKKIKYDTLWYEFRNYDYKEIHKGIIDEQTSFVEKIDFYKLNDEVEIIEEDKNIEKLDITKDYNGNGAMLINQMATTDYQMLQVANKINEIIDKINAGVDKE